jgi:hypothetical protein
MNIAVVIGIKNYTNLESLPACEKDANKMKELLDATGKYSKVVSLTQNTEASKIKSLLRDFFKEFSGKEIKEIFFYFSGHGTYSQGDALFCCSDFDSKRPNTTSLANREIDDYMRSVKPKLAVKVLDACSSGVKYIKDSTKLFQKAFEETELESFIAMFSSQLDQSSFASEKLSDFTKSFIEGALSKSEGEEIYYRDIQSYISDAFMENSDQTPWFVNQVTGLEVFAKSTSAMIALRNVISQIGKEEEPGDITALIEDKIREIDSRFIPLDEVLTALLDLQGKLLIEKPKDPLVSKYYTYDFIFKSGLATLVRMEEIASRASEREWDKVFFVSIDKERRRVPFSGAMVGALSDVVMVGSTAESKGATSLGSRFRTIFIPKSISSTHALPFETIEIIAKPNKNVLKQFGAMVGMVHSRTDVLILSTTTRYKNVGWDSRIIDDSSANWAIMGFKWQDLVSNPTIIYVDVLSQLDKEILDYLKSFGEEKVTITDFKPS